METLLLLRHEGSRFAAGNFVFPGGRVETDDMPANAGSFCAGLTPNEAARRLGDTASPDLALGFWAGAIRETFEEVGVLLAYTADGRMLSLARETARRFEAHRRACHRDGSAFWAMLREERLTLATDRLVYFAHWVTPEESRIRYDTRFFAAECPPEQHGSADGHEITACRWMAPEEATAASVRGEIALRPPTFKNLTLLIGFPGVQALLTGLDGRRVPTIRPRIIPDGEGQRVLFPGDPGWY